VLIEIARWFNYRFPWHHLKPSLAKRIRSRLDARPVRQVYGGIQGDLRMLLDLSVHLERDIYLNVSNMQMLSVFRRVLRADDVVIDGGANIGLFSLVASRCVGPHGRIYAFEPQPAVSRLLHENIALNRADNITVVGKAASDQSGQATFYEFEDSTHDLPSLGKRPDKKVERAYQVETVRIDDVVNERVRLYKLDIEGAEWFAMRGSERILFSDPPPHVIIELNPRTCAGFGHHPLQVLDWFLERAPNRRIHLIRRRRCQLVDRKLLAELFEDKPNKSHNVWLEPRGEG